MASTSTQNDFGYFRERDDADLIIIKLIAFCMFVVCFIVYVGLFLNNIYHITYRGGGDKGKTNTWTNAEAGSDARRGFYTSVTIQSYVGIALVIAADVLSYYDRERYGGRLDAGSNWFTSISMIVACVIFCVQTYVFFIHPGYDDMMCGMDVHIAEFEDNELAIQYENELFTPSNFDLSHAFFTQCVDVRDVFILKINELTSALTNTTNTLTTDQISQKRKELADIKNKLDVSENVDRKNIFKVDPIDGDEIENKFVIGIETHGNPVATHDFGLYAFYSHVQPLNNAQIHTATAHRATIDLYNAKMIDDDALSSDIVSARKAYIQNFSNDNNSLFYKNDFDSSSFDSYVDNCKSVETRYNEMHSMFSSSLFNVFYKLDKYNNDQEAKPEADPEENLHKRATFAHYIQTAVFLLGFFGVFGTALDYALEINEVTKRGADMAQDKNDLDKYRNAIVQHILGAEYSWGRDSDNDGNIKRGGVEVAIKVIAGKDGPEYEIIGTDPDGIDQEKIIFANEIIDRMMELKHFTEWRNAGGTKRVLKRQIEEWTEKFDFDKVMARKSRVDYETHKKKLGEKDKEIERLEGTIDKKDDAAKQVRDKDIEELAVKLKEKENEVETLSADKLSAKNDNPDLSTWFSTFLGMAASEKELTDSLNVAKAEVKQLQSELTNAKETAKNAEEKAEADGKKATQNIAVAKGKATNAERKTEETQRTLENLRNTFQKLKDEHEGDKTALSLATQDLTRQIKRIDELSDVKTQAAMKAEKIQYNNILDDQSKIVRKIIDEKYNIAGNLTDAEKNTMKQVENFVYSEDTILGAKGQVDAFPQKEFDKQKTVLDKDAKAKAKLFYIFLPWIMTDRPQILQNVVAGAA